jgi:phosphatidate cytidylyltransferase
MLKQRIWTAVALLAVFLPALFWKTSLPIACLALLLMMVAAWEWGALNTNHQFAPTLCSISVLALASLTWFFHSFDVPLMNVWIAGGGLWVVVSTYLLYVGLHRWRGIPLIFRLVGGVFALWLAWFSMVYAHHIGVNFLLSLMVLVWVADCCAYFSGRRFGLRWIRSKLAPAISPGKSWEGVWGGALGVLLLSIIWIIADHYLQPASLSLYSLVFAKGWWWLPVCSMFMVAFSVVGDLLESLVKRSAGVKDSGRSLPGHGGVLDRVDALLPTLPIGLMLISYIQWL